MEPAIESGAQKLAPLREITAALIKHFGYHEGLYDIAFGVQISVGKIGQGDPAATPAAPLPGVSFGINGIGLAKVQVAGPDTVDAAEVNPAQSTAQSKVAGQATSSLGSTVPDRLSSVSPRTGPNRRPGRADA